jgi:hypothetical protein
MKTKFKYKQMNIKILKSNNISSLWEKYLKNKLFKQC